VMLTDATPTERTVEGHLDACELTYLLAFQDNIYRNGGTVFLRGSFMVSAITADKDKAPGIVFKITAFDLVGEQTQLAPVNYAFVTANNQSFAGTESGKFKCEDGGLCLAYCLP
jgi:hypothetical protein